jgi:predicted lipoprotein with Yx(FWY)xxD motif
MFMRRDVTRSRLLLVGMIAGLLTLAACGSSTSSSPAGSSGGGSSASGAPVSAGSGIKTTSTSLGTVLTDSKGFTLYWFAIDTPTTSKCNGTCLTYWPIVKGPVKAAHGVSLPGKFGTITRSDGTVQATYDGHPLYTYSGDNAPGQTSGNALNVSGGLWYAVTPSGAKPTAGGAAPATSSSSGGGSGGYGY